MFLGESRYLDCKSRSNFVTGLTNAGTMFFFVAVSAVGLLWVWFFVPELKNMSLESVDAVFDLPWCKCSMEFLSTNVP